MKKIVRYGKVAIITLLLLVICVGLGYVHSARAGLATRFTSDRRVGKIDVPQLTFPNGATGATLTQTQDVYIHGVVKQITVGLNNNTGDKTVVVTLVDADGSVLYTAASTAENTASAPVAQQYMTQSSTDLPLNILCDGTITVTGLISGDPGTSTGLCDITLYVD